MLDIQQVPRERNQLAQWMPNNKMYNLGEGNSFQIIFSLIKM